jgi:rare lipoprotein A
LNEYRKALIALMFAASLAAPLPAQAAYPWHYARASWYGLECGTRTASGIPLNARSLTFAHKSMRFGTRVQFTYRGRTCIGVCTDRGPFIRGRTFDFGPAMARRLRFGGVGQVRYRIVGWTRLR